MGNTLDQWRSAIGCHNNFIKSKNSAALFYLLERMNSLLECYGPVIIPMFLNFPYYYMLLSLCTWKVELLHEAKVKQTKYVPKKMTLKYFGLSYVLKTKGYFATCYRPPGATALQVDSFIDSLSNQVECAMNDNPDALIMVGDFNGRCIHWDDRQERSEMGLKFYNYLNDVNLFQLVDEPTRITENSASLLDLIITDSPGYIDNLNVLPPIGDLDHNIVYGYLTFVTDRPESIKRTVWHYDRANFMDLNIEFANAPWNTAFMLFDDPNEILEYLGI